MKALGGERLRAVGLAASVVAAIVVACGSDPESGPPVDTTPDAAPAPPDAGGDANDEDAGGSRFPRRGTRLAPRMLVTDDGLSQFDGIVDRQLDARCAPALAADGKVRCVPVAPAPLEPLFADADCTEPLVAFSTGFCETKFVTSVGAESGCAMKTSHHAVGAVHDGPIHRRQPGGECTAEAAPPGVVHHRVGPALPADELVAMTFDVEPIGGGVGFEAVSGADGSRFPHRSMIDLARNEPCIDVGTTDVRCLPDTSGRLDGFLDDGCSQAVVQVAQYCRTGEPTAATVVDGSAPPRVVALGTRHATHDFYARDGAMCVGPQITSDDLYAPGPDLPLASFPALGETRTGGTRITARRRTAGGAPLPTAIELHDEELDVRCSDLTATDGQHRCLPDYGAVSYTDASCEQPIYVSIAAATVPKYVLQVIPGCPTQYAVRPSGAAIATPATRYRRTSTGCIATPIPDDAVVYAVGAEIPPATFAAFTLRVD